MPHSLFVQAVPAEGPRWSAVRSTPSFMLIYKTALFLTGVSHTVVLSSEKSKVPGSRAAHPVCVKAKTCGQKR